MWYNQKLSARQIAYREFLKTPIWRALSKEKRRLVPYCEVCDKTTRLQAHHVIYPPRWEDTTLDMLRVVCSTCHRREHGMNVYREFYWKIEEAKTRLTCEHLPTHEDDLELTSLAETGTEIFNLESFFRLSACMRAVYGFGGRHNKWHYNKVKDKLWLWATQKRKRLQAEVGMVDITPEEAVALANEDEIHRATVFCREPVLWNSQKFISKPALHL